MLLSLTLAVLKASWTINSFHTMLWNDVPYLPIGLRAPFEQELLDVARTSGIEDFWIDGAADTGTVKTVVDYANAHRLRFIFAIDQRLPSAKGFAVEPDAYRLGPVRGSVKLNTPLPGATRAFVLLADQRNGETLKSAMLPVLDGRLYVDMEAPDDLDYVLLVYPELNESPVPDLWSGLDKHRDQLLRLTATLKQSEGLRAIANPLGRLIDLPGLETRFVPVGDSARIEFEAYMRSKYRNLDSALRSWSVTGVDFSDFKELVKLIPLWSGSRGVGQFLHPDTGHLYPAGMRSSSYWSDMGGFFRATASRRMARMASLLGSETGVPVIQEWFGWNTPAAKGDGIAGIGWECSGEIPSEWYRGGMGAGAAQRHGQTWSVASDIRVPVAQFAAVVDETAGMGARAWFFKASKPDELRAIAEQSRRVSGDVSLSQWKPTAVYFPEAVTMPATTSRIVGGLWWFPDNLPGTRLDIGNRYRGYRIETAGASTILIWTDRTNVRVKFRSPDAKSVVARNLDGSDPKLKPIKGGFEATFGSGPMEIRSPGALPIPEDSIEEAIDETERLIRLIESRSGLADQERFVLQEILSGLDRAPADAVTALRRQLRRIQANISYWVWLEAEDSTEHNFGLVLNDPGASAGKSLAVKCQIEPLGGAFSASYSLSPRRVGKHEVWLALGGTTTDAALVSVIVAGQQLRAVGNGLSRYGRNYAWYRLGEVSLPRENQKVLVQVDGRPGAFVAIDAILITPTTFQPNGVALPAVDNL